MLECALLLDWPIKEGIETETGVFKIGKKLDNILGFYRKEWW